MASLSVTLDPTTVTLQLPVGWPFVRPDELSSGAVYVICATRLPVCSPDVALIDRVAPMPTPVLHSTLLSDRHVVDAPPLPPRRRLALYAQWPAPPWPTTVTLIDPVMATFVFAALLDCVPSYVTPDVKLPTNVDVVDVCTRADNMPDELFTTKLLLDRQIVDAPRLPPTRPVTLYCQWPDPEPTTVTLVAPVVATFDGDELLTEAPSTVIAVNKLP